MIEEAISQIFGIWYLIGAALVFFMQAGFAMVEAGFTRAKNAGNIIMKNTMDFCLGTVAFLILGFSLLCGAQGNAFVGWGGHPLTDFAGTDWSTFTFNLVFCATAATIVSGAMAERTKFISYCVYSFVISLLIYPVEAHWVWGPDGWLTAMGFHDFAGSAVIHFAGGLCALIGASMLGARIGKFKDGKPMGIPGHNIVIGALGVFILWFGWYGFNGAAACHKRSAAGHDFRHNYRGTGSGSLHSDGFYLDQVRQTGCIHDTKRCAGRSGGHHRRMRRRQRVGRLHHRHCVRLYLLFPGVAAGLQTACG